MSTKVVLDSNGHKRLLPEEVPDTEADKGIPLGIHLAGLDLGLPDLFVNELQAELEKKRFIQAEDFHKPGAYRVMAEALKQVIKVTANNIVDRIREEA